MERPVKKSMMVTMIVTALATASLATGCSSDDEAAKPGSSSGSSGQSSSGLSLAFASRCARCHGTTATGQGIYPALPGKLTADAYKAVVRSGRQEMPSFDASQISDADLAADYAWMTTKR
jgi:mono/diheme cytochrome c family protein